MQQVALVSPVEEILALQSSFLASKSASQRKSLGQFFTNAVVSEYMASLLSKPQNDVVRILDAGAGTGILAAYAALQCLNLGCKVIHVVLYEVDSKALPNLEKTLQIVHDIFRQQRRSFTFEIKCEDFLLARPDRDTSIQSFDISIINPPYFKYSAKNSPYAKAVADLYHGDPNIYASFLAVALSSMNDGGQVVSITPRSFTNGLYFKGFRSYLLGVSALDLIHIFKYRDKVFKNHDSAVLQENIICRLIKGKKSKVVTVRASDCAENIYNAEENTYPIGLVVDSSNKQNIIRIPESSQEARILRQAENLPVTFEEAGYFISTGRVVEHRAREYISAETKTSGSVPLYRPHNVTPLTATWNGENKKDVVFLLSAGHEKHTMKNDNFVLLKRFSSKDEKRRLVAGVHLEGACECEYIGFGNKINYIGVADQELSNVEAYGLAAIFNSSFMDKYFRCISGNTQVNATEIRVMKFPTRKQVCEIGEKIGKLRDADTKEIDLVVNPVLGLMNLV